MDRLFQNQTLCTILHNVLEAKKTKYQVSSFSPQKEPYGYNQYSLLIIMDLLVKYQIIVGSAGDEATFINQLEQVANQYQTHQELVFACHQLLAEAVRGLLRLQEVESAASKRLILEYVYQKYIVEGYCFHSFPSVFKNEVLAKGLVLMNEQYPVAEIKKLQYIFSKHHYQKLVTKDVKKAPCLLLTDSFALAYSYALQSPQYLSDLVATGPYYTALKYDREAYYRKDKQVCFQNINQLLAEADFSEKEQKTIYKSLNKQWQLFSPEQASPCVAFIKRKALGKHSLPDIEAIYSESKTLPIAYSMARITDSRYPTIRRYSPILATDFVVHELPTYQMIKNNYSSVKSFSKPVVLAEVPLQQPLNNAVKPLPKMATNHGNASVWALFGLLCVSLGLTLTIIFRLYGVGG